MYFNFSLKKIHIVSNYFIIFAQNFQNDNNINNMREAVRNIQCTIPLSDFDIFKRFANGMGWSFSTMPKERKQAKKEITTTTSDLEYIMSLHAVGGTPVPADENPLDALAESKYL